MKTRRLIITQIFFVLSLFLISSNFVQAETTECTVITSLPYTISTQGIYCLKGDLGTSMTSGNAIQIDTNNVVIDLNGYKIGGLAAGLGTMANRIYAYQRKNVTIRNGTIRGFSVAIWLDDSSAFTTSQGHLVENIRADENTVIGMFVIGSGDIIRNNQVITTGGTLLSSATERAGIAVFGPGATIKDNDISGMTSMGTKDSYGIMIGFSTGSFIENNRINNVYSPGGSVSGIMVFWPSDSLIIINNHINNPAFINGNSYGIRILEGNDHIVSDNRITKMQYGIYFDTIVTGTYMNNLVRGATTPFTGGTAAGSTNFSN